MYLSSNLHYTIDRAGKVVKAAGNYIASSRFARLMRNTKNGAVALARSAYYNAKNAGAFAMTMSRQAGRAVLVSAGALARMTA